MPHTHYPDCVQQTAKPKPDPPSPFPSLPLPLTDQTPLPHPRQPLAAAPADYISAVCTRISSMARSTLCCNTSEHHHASTLVDETVCEGHISSLWLGDGEEVMRILNTVLSVRKWVFRRSFFAQSNFLVLMGRVNVAGEMLATTPSLITFAQAGRVKAQIYARSNIVCLL